jgi:hypothetical protein
MRRNLIFVGALAQILAQGAPAATAAPAQSGTPKLGCEASALKPPSDVTVTSAKRIAAPVGYCRFDGYVTTTNPGPNKVHFMLAAPDNWNGRFLFTVQGGAAGFVPDPTEPNLREGYAIASTDKGVVTSGGLDFSFRSNPAMDLDWNWRGTHVAAVAAQGLTRQYYGRETFYRYVMGCSGGGTGTISEAERYPDDFDAHIAGSTAMDWPYGNDLNWAVYAQHLNKAPGSWISPDQYRQIYTALLAKYDSSDGAIDGLIWDPRVIKLDAADRKTLGFLTDAQFQTLKLIASPIRDRSGKIMSPGYMLGNPSKWGTFLTGKTPPPWKNLQDYPSGFQVTETAAQGRMGASFSFLNSQDVTTYRGEIPGIPGSLPDHRRLGGLLQNGHKLIVWEGVAEEAVPPDMMIGYTDRASRTFGPQRASFLRNFMVPGLHHCRSGDGAPTDMTDAFLKAAERWVEDGKAPDSVTLTDRALLQNAPAPDSAPTRTYLICSYPARARFAGGVSNPQKLDVNDAKNWRCVA